MEFYDVNDEILKLNKEFIKIKNMGYVKGKNNKSRANAGITFESLLGKENDSFQTADYNGIEIKVKNGFQFRHIALFSLVPSNCFGFGLKNIRNKYGYYDPDFKDKKVFCEYLSANKFTYLKSGYYAKINVKEADSKIYLCFYDDNKNLIDDELYWDFDDVINTVERKLKALCVVKYRKIKKEDNDYFSYTNINFYKIKKIDALLDLLSNGTIKIYVCLGLYKSGPKIGQDHDHGVNFVINESSILKLYNKYNAND